MTIGLIVLELKIVITMSPRTENKSSTSFNIAANAGHAESVYSSNLYQGQSGARFYSTRSQRIMETLSAQQYNWTKQKMSKKQGHLLF